MNKTKVISVNAKWYEDCDNCLEAAANDVCDDLGLDGYDCQPRWEDDNNRERILLTVPEWCEI